MIKTDEKGTFWEKLDDWALDHIPAFIYRIPTKIRNIISEIRWFFQRVFRKNHTSDNQIWDLAYTLIDYIRPKLQAFIDTEKMGYPAIFSEYNENEWRSKEEYDKAIKEGKHLGGGPEAWDKVLKEMMFAFDFYHWDGEIKETDFLKKYNLEDPYEKKPENKVEMDDNWPDFLRDEDYYHNLELHREYHRRAEKGLELFGKFFMNLWD